HTIPEGEIELSGELIGKNAFEVVQNISTPVERSIALAILNALGNIDIYQPGDPLEILTGNKLCVFGYSPNVSNAKFHHIIVYDFSNPQFKLSGNVEIRPFSSFSKDSCDTAVIFGSSLVNGTIDNILRNIQAKELVLTGVSSVDAPSTLKSLGFNMIGKVLAIDKHRALRTICEGGGARQLARYTTKVFRTL
ncbi:MAG: DUF364 domain-containing protein, partial [Sulfolobus sp.]|nr:DUF364 domain-containing protein [Sulfolobus sp.]